MSLMISTATLDSVPRSTRSDAPNTVAFVEAATNAGANLVALSQTQPALADRLRDVTCDASWIYGRDGTLTAMNEDGTWWAGCSVPLAASQSMLKSLEGPGTTACFLFPFHAAALRAALDMRKPEQAVIAIVPDERALAVMLRCEDFSFDIAHNRLWLVCGEAWPAQLDRLFTAQPGLPTPTQFIRLRDGNEESADALIEPAQRVISKHVAERARAIAMLREQPRVRRGGEIDPSRLCFIAPSRFRLWDDSGYMLGSIARAMGGAIFDSDDPASASPLALASRLVDCDIVIGSNASRAEAAGVAPLDLPWITWLTTPRVPPVASAGPNDRLLIADERWREIATNAGWSPDRVSVATMPVINDERKIKKHGRDTHATKDSQSFGISTEHYEPCLEYKTCPADAERALTIIADTLSLQPPARIVDMSSHRLLWELMRDELLDNPFATGTSIVMYLDRWIARSGIAPASIDRPCLIDQLIAPAYAQGVVRALSSSGVPLRVFGQGWNELPAGVHRGNIDSRDTFREAVRSSLALVHVWPMDVTHPIDTCGRPVLGRCKNKSELLDFARRLLTETPGAVSENTATALSSQLLGRIITNTFS